MKGGTNLTADTIVSNAKAEALRIVSHGDPRTGLMVLTGCLGGSALTQDLWARILPAVEALLARPQSPDVQTATYFITSLSLPAYV